MSYHLSKNMYSEGSSKEYGSNQNLQIQYFKYIFIFKSLGPFCAQTQCDAQPCENGGICKLTSSGFICVCPDKRFGGKRCHQRLHPCDALLRPCSGHGICHDDDKSKETSLGYRCQCHLWWSG